MIGYIDISRGSFQMKIVKKIIVVTMMLLAMLGTIGVAFHATTEVVEASASRVKLNKTKITLAVGKSYTLKASGSIKKATWSTSKKLVASISAKKVKSVKITAKNVGKSTISYKVGKKTYKCVVTVVNPKLSATKATITVGKTTTLSVTGGSGTVKWASNNTSVATVSNGIVKGIKKGTATITATSNGKKLTCNITVNAKASTPTPTPKPTATPVPKPTVHVHDQGSNVVYTPAQYGTPIKVTAPAGSTYYTLTGTFGVNRCNGCGLDVSDPDLAKNHAKEEGKKGNLACMGYSPVSEYKQDYLISTQLHHRWVQNASPILALITEYIVPIEGYFFTTPEIKPAMCYQYNYCTKCGAVWNESIQPATEAPSYYGY